MPDNARLLTYNCQQPNLLTSSTRAAIFHTKYLRDVLRATSVDMPNWDISDALANGITNLSTRRKHGHVPYRQLSIVGVAVRYCTDDPGSPSPASDLPELKRLLTADTQEPLPNQLRPRFHRHGLSQSEKTLENFSTDFLSIVHLLRETVLRNKRKKQTKMTGVSS